MKGDLLKLKRIFSRIMRVCVISIFFFEMSGKLCAAQQIDPNVERKENLIDTYFVLYSDGEGTITSNTLAKNKMVQNQAWEPPPPPPDKFDWIQLTSGEWLKGELKRLYERKLEFDSEELDLQEFDWEDVKFVRGPRYFSVRFAGRIEVIGTLQVTEDKVIVTVGDKKQVFNRNRLVAIAAGGEKEFDYWSGKLSFGANFSEGNTEELQYSTIATIKRRTSATRFIFDYLGNLTKTNNVETVNNQRIQSTFDVFITQKYFLRPVFAEVYRDPFTNIKYRATLGFGMGYDIIDTPRTEWKVSAGPAYQTTEFDSVEPGEDSREWTPAFIAGTNFDTELTKRMDFIFKYDLQILNNESGTYTHHLITTLETELTKWLDFDTSFVWDRVENPKPNDDGTVPEKDDYYLIFSLGIDF